MGWTEAQEARIKQVMESSGCTRGNAIRVMRREETSGKKPAGGDKVLGHAVEPVLTDRAERQIHKAAAARKPKAAAPKSKEYLVHKYEALRLDTDKGKKLLQGETQGGMIYRACSKGPATFAEILEAISPKLRGQGKTAETIENNSRWYVNDLRKKGLLRYVEEKVEAKSADEARGAE